MKNFLLTSILLTGIMLMLVSCGKPSTDLSQEDQKDIRENFTEFVVEGRLKPETWNNGNPFSISDGIFYKNVKTMYPSCEVKLVFDEKQHINKFQEEYYKAIFKTQCEKTGENILMGLPQVFRKQGRMRIYFTDENKTQWSYTLQMNPFI